MSRQHVRGGRAAWAAAAGVLVAAAGHALGSGAALETSALPVVVAVSAASAVATTRIRWTVARVAGALFATQVLVHLALWITSAPSSTHPRLAGVAPPSAVEAHAHTAMAGLTTRMLTAHVLAAVVTAAALVAVDRLVALVRAVAARLSFLRTVPPPLGRVPRAAITVRRAVVPRLVHLEAMRSNAPPVLADLG